MATERTQRFRYSLWDPTNLRPIPEILQEEALHSQAELAVEPLDKQIADKLLQPEVHLDDDLI